MTIVEATKCILKRISVILSTREIILTLTYQLAQFNERALTQSDAVANPLSMRTLG